MKNSPLIQLVTLFIIIFFSLNWVYQESRDTIIEHFIIDTLTVLPSAFLINIIKPSEHAHAQEHSIISSTAKLSILNGCEGIESMLLLIAAILAFKTGWRHKFYGILAGCTFIYILNQIRIITLYFSLHYYRNLFSAIHEVIGPTIIILLASLLYFWWLRWPENKFT